MTRDDGIQDAGTPTGRDIGWKQFTIGIFDLIRWPIAVVVIFFLLRMPLERLLDAMATAFRA
jgi:hypothetical protein